MRFFHAKCVQKRTPTAFLVDITLCSRTLEVLSCFPTIFCKCWDWYIERSRSYQEKHSKMPKDVFATFALKISLFSLKTGAKAHSELQHGRTSMRKQFPVKNTQPKKIHTILQKIESSGMRGLHLRHLFFLNTQTSQRELLWAVAKFSVCSSFAPKTFLLARLYGKWGNRVVSNTRFDSSIGRMEHGASIFWIPRTLPKTLKNAAKHLLRHAQLLSGDSLSHYKCTHRWERAILDHTCQQIPLKKHTTGIRKNHPKYRKNPSKYYHII